MQHDYIIEGINYRLRPADIDDSAFIISLRMNDNLNKYLNPVSGKIEDQHNWFEEYFKRQNDYYFVIERLRDKRAEGLISVYDIDPYKKEGEWGRWVLRENSNAAVESSFLIYNFSFDILSLDKVYCRTVADNKKVCSFHDSCGLERGAILPCYFLNKYDAQEHYLRQEAWEQKKEFLHRIIRRTNAA